MPLGLKVPGTTSKFRCVRAFPSVGNRTIPDMINFCPPDAQITARRVLENVLRSLGCSAITGIPFPVQPPPWGPAPVPEGELAERARTPDRCWTVTYHSTSATM